MTDEELRTTLARMPDASLREAIETVAKEDPVVWAMYYRRIRGMPLVYDNSRNVSFEAVEGLRRSSKNSMAFQTGLSARLLRHRPWLIEPLRDPHPYKTWMKGRQMGVSEAAYIEEVWFLAEHSRTKGIHTFPREKNLKRFVSTRVDPSFEETPRMRALLGKPDGIFLKRIRDSFLILDSAWESQLGEGVDADIVTLDERDRMNPGVENAFIQALESSPYKLFRELSTPTMPDRGVGYTHSISDQREWLVRCSSCGLEQEILYPDNVIQMKDFALGSKQLAPGTYEYLCRLERCRGKLDRMNGRWVAKRPSIENIRGYHMGHPMCIWMSATDLMQNKIKLRWPDVWTKYCLGLPAVGEGALLTEADYERACAGHELLEERTSDWTDVVAGIDWGHLNWIQVRARNVHNNRRYTIGLMVFEDDPREPLEGSSIAAERYLAPFAPDVIVADDGFGKDRNAYLRKRFDGTGTMFFACRFSPAPRNTRQFRPVWNEVGNQVLIDKAMWCKVACRAIKTGDVGLPSYDEPNAALLKEHLKALRPMREEDEDTGELIEVIVSNGPDHLAMTTIYCEVADEWLSENSRAGLV